ncbi:hypothetical protein BDY19DRAFT_1060394 [Irpex rosettiformis]|uniref:Uncharacterized protein n=1 Tax=Irpex rosettiformis TaxID=378272 RepID=A0ACB8TR63_9APHY|nr:hypothetical protein BDY19DRAFT_1060394 [Irpex rosettiformis]
MGSSVSVVRAVLDACNIRAPLTTMVSTCLTSVSDAYTQLTHSVLDVAHLAHLQLSSDPAILAIVGVFVYLGAFLYTIQILLTRWPLFKLKDSISPVATQQTGLDEPIKKGSHSEIYLEGNPGTALK